MASSSKGLFEEEIEQALLEKLTDSHPSNSSSNDDSSATDALAVGKVIVMECSDNKGDIQQGATACSAPSSSAMFTWKDTTKHVGQRKQSVGNCGPPNGAQNETHYTNVFKVLSTDELVKLIVFETNTQNKNTSYKSHSISFQNTGLETCHYR
jgi:hypothetical protein